LRYACSFILACWVVRHLALLGLGTPLFVEVPQPGYS